MNRVSMKSPYLRSVFYPSDFIADEQPAFEHALKVALAARGRLDLFHVVRPEEDYDVSLFPSVRSTLERWGAIPFGSTAEAVEDTGLEVRRVHARSQGVLATLEEHVAAAAPDLLVLASHQRTGTDRWLHRALAEPLARECHVPTLWVPRHGRRFVSEETGDAVVRTVLVPVDHEPGAQPAVSRAEALLRTLGIVDAHFILLHVGPAWRMPRVQVSSGSGFTHEVETWEGDVVDHIVASAEANDADLVVMAKAGQRSPLDALRGSTTERVARECPCPLLIVPVEAEETVAIAERSESEWPVIPALA
jgi:nucleotide-binding universal stress UspA family protein